METPQPQQIPQGEHLATENLLKANVPNIYSNMVRITTSFFDIRFLFAEAIAVSDGKGVAVPHITIAMSPEHAKALAKVLINTIEKYEERFGEIREQPEETQSQEVE